MKKIALLLTIWSTTLMGQDELPSIEKFFNAAEYGSMKEVCEEFYAPNIHFVDPIGELKGLDKMILYYKNMYENVISIRFEIHKEATLGQEKFANWTMYLRHKTVNDGNEIVLDGVSHVRFENGKAVFHRDYFDPGPMIYEHIPVFGSLYRWIKGKIQKNTHT